MKKIDLKVQIVIGIIFVIYTVSLILLINDRNENFWINYMFSIVSLVIQFVLLSKTIKKTKTQDDLFLSLPILIVSATYFFVQLFVSVIFTIINVVNSISIIVQLIILGIFIILAIALNSGRDYISKNRINDKEN